MCIRDRDKGNGFEIEANDCEVDDLAMEGNPVIEIKEAWFRYGKEEKDVLRGVNLSIPKGKFSVIMGGNGSGKSIQDIALLTVWLCNTV